jgi:hypothetical protein
LKVLDSPYREITRPILKYVREYPKKGPRDIVTVIIPEYVVGHWWEQLLHNQSALRLKGRLLFLPDVVVIDVPWHLRSAGVSTRSIDAEQLNEYRQQAAAAKIPAAAPEGQSPG